MYIHEFVDVIGTERARYQHHMTANWVPSVVGVRRQRCFGVFSVVGSTGRWPQVVNLWELDSWADLAHDFELELSAPGHRDPILSEWWERAASFRTGGTDRILVSHPDSPGVEEWSARGGTGAVAYLHETLRCAPGGAPGLCDAVVGAVAREHAGHGLRLVAAFRTAMGSDDEVIVVWGLPDWPTWAAYESAVDAGGLPALRDASARDRILLVDAELSPLRLGRQPTEDDRRPLESF